MKAFDVFLKDRLTKIDIVISTLTSREIFSFYDKILIDCAVSELNQLKKLSAQSSMHLDSEIQRLILSANILAKTTMCLEGDASLTNVKLVDAENNDFVIHTNPTEIIRNIAFNAQADMTLTATLDYWDVKLSLGDVSFKNIIKTSSADTHKTSYLHSDNESILLCNVDFSGKKLALLDPIDLFLKTRPLGLFYPTYTSGNTAFFIGTKAISELIHNRILPHIGLETNIHAVMTDETVAIKGLSGNSNLQLLSSVVFMLNKMFAPSNSEANLFCVASVELQRQRKLSETDEYNLSWLDGKSMKEIDYILVN